MAKVRVGVIVWGRDALRAGGFAAVALGLSACAHVSSTTDFRFRGAPQSVQCMQCYSWALAARLGAR